MTGKPKLGRRISVSWIYYKFSPIVAISSCCWFFSLSFKFYCHCVLKFHCEWSEMNLSECLLSCKKHLKAYLGGVPAGRWDWETTSGAVFPPSLPPSSSIPPPGSEIWNLAAQQKKGLFHIWTIPSPCQIPPWHGDTCSPLHTHTHTPLFWRHCLFNLQLCVQEEWERDIGAKRRDTGGAIHVRSLVLPTSWILQHQREEQIYASRREAGCSNDNKCATRNGSGGEQGCEKETQRWNLWEGLRYEATGINPRQHLSCCHGGLPQPKQEAIGQLSRETEQHVRGALLFTADWVFRISVLVALSCAGDLCCVREWKIGLETSRL